MIICVKLGRRTKYRTLTSCGREASPLRPRQAPDDLFGDSMMYSMINDDVFDDVFDGVSMINDDAFDDVLDGVLDDK